MAGTTYTAALRGGGPWGFRLQGGKDFGSPLAISKVARRKLCPVSICFAVFVNSYRVAGAFFHVQVTPGSKADFAGIKSGDYVLEVSGDSSDNMTHFDAQDAVRRAGQNLDLLLQR